MITSLLTKDRKDLPLSLATYRVPFDFIRKTHNFKT